jgi:prefoldin subunit 5
MWAAGIFMGITLISLPAAIASGNEMTIVTWVAQTFLQLVLLPIILVGQNIQAAASDRRAIATYEDAGAILEEAKQLQSHLTDQDKALSHIIDRLEALEAQLKAQPKK